MVKSVAERVQAGIDYLNANHTGWVDKIQLDKLNMMETDLEGYAGKACITAQLGIKYDDSPNGGVLYLDTNLGFVPVKTELELELRNEWIKRINELRKPKLTVQQEKNKVFKAIVDGLIKQKLVRAMDNNHKCRYRGDNGTKCAAGHIIPDCDYSEKLEGFSVAVECSNPPTEYFIGKYPKEVVKMMASCQGAHDSNAWLGSSKAEWAERMLEIYKEHKINSPITQAKLQTVVELFS